jgi:hypothetical protein
MSHFDTIKKLLLVGMLFATSQSWAQNQTELPPGVQRLIFAEQKLLSRDLNEERVMSPKDNKQDDHFKPENGQTFEVKSFWVPKSQLSAFTSEHMSATLKKLFVKNHGGQENYLVLVHPESESFYEELTRSADRGPKFWATSTASSRTLVMWPDQRPELAFFGKLSLNKEIGGVVRTIPQGEVARSLGTTEVLYKNESILPKSFRFLPESLSLIPKGWPRGGMIIREIPADLAAGKADFIPLFSLYADRGDAPPLLAEMIQKSGMDAKTFVDQKIISPFIKQWMEMVLIHGISMEPHAQNVLIGLDANGMPNGKFMHRDFGGFNLDLESFAKLNTLLPKALPSITSVAEDYHQKFSKSSVNESLEVFFEQGFVYNLDQKLPEWVKKGWIGEYPRSTISKSTFSGVLYKDVIAEVLAFSGGKISVNRTQAENDLYTAIENARSSSPYLIKARCELVFQ